MTRSGDPAPDAFEDALLAARLCAIDPLGLGGLVLRGGAEMRDAVIAELRAALPLDAPVRRIPAHVDDDRLIGGLDLGATLARGTAVIRAGLLAEADGGLVVVPMAERLAATVAGRLAAVLDTGEVVVERDGAALRANARIAVVALDDGIEPEETVPVALADRLAFRLDLTITPHRHPGLVPGATFPLGASAPVAGWMPEQARHDAVVGAIVASEDQLRILSATAAALGIDSARPPLFALRAARASAKLAGRPEITDADMMIAARLVLAPRATRIPATDEAAPDEAPPPSEGGEDGQDDCGEPGPVEDRVLAAALAALPRDVLARIAARCGQRRSASLAQGKGERLKSARRGRPMGARAGLPRGGLRLSLIDTLRAAAPWQASRGRGGGRIRIRRDDLHVRRYETRAEALTIFAVDASGSSALARLAEAKGAVELLLAQAYVRRAQVALVAFRGRAAELLLPPTRSLARARRSLADLPGGGGTPLAAGLNAARELAEAARARGRPSRRAGLNPLGAAVPSWTSRTKS